MAGRRWGASRAEGLLISEEINDETSSLTFMTGLCMILFPTSYHS